jgi:O6-methylguanine-DNA--protein-cysteine methyltransferase
VFEKSKLCSLRYTGEGVPSSVQACAYAEPDVVQTLSSTVARAYRKAVQQLNLYLAGKLHEFSLPLKIYGTDFQKKVWEAIAEIPYGKRGLTSRWPKRLESPAPRVPWAPPSARTRYRLSSPAIAWWARAEAWSATPWGSTSSDASS